MSELKMHIINGESIDMATFGNSLLGFSRFINNRIPNEEYRLQLNKVKEGSIELLMDIGTNIIAGVLTNFLFEIIKKGFRCVKNKNIEKLDSNITHADARNFYNYLKLSASYQDIIIEISYIDDNGAPVIVRIDKEKAIILQQELKEFMSRNKQ